MLNASLTAANCFLHLGGHARPPELVLQQRKYSLLTLVPSIPMASIHVCHSVGCGDQESHCFFQLSSWSMAMIENTLMKHKLLPLSKKGYALLHSGKVPQEAFHILYIMGGEPFHHNFKHRILLLGSHPTSYMQIYTCVGNLCLAAAYLTSLCIFLSASATAGS